MLPRNDHPTGSHEALQGWTSQPSGRGTFDILVSCVVTIILCSWSAICCNVPTSDNSKTDLFWDKWHMFCCSILGPEFVIVLALGQFMSARTSLRAFQKLGCTEWTLKHAFYAEMGGFAFEAQGWTSFPVDAKQLLYLLEHEYLTPAMISAPIVTKAILDDKDKSDGLARFVSPKKQDIRFLTATRFITIVQMIWFTLNVIARAAQNLTVSTFELTTVAFVVCTLATSFCWRHKPMDVSTRTVVKSSYTMGEILVNAGPAASKPYKKTPLEFIAREKWRANFFFDLNVDILNWMHIVRQRPRAIPAQRLSSFDFPKLSRLTLLAPLCLSLGYSAIFFVAWNATFPTTTERLLWRLSASTTFAIVVFVGILEVTPLGHVKFVPIRRAEEASAKTSEIGLLPLSGPRPPLPDNVSASAPTKSYGVESTMWGWPLWAIAQPVLYVYAVCRAYIIIEDFIGLRALPASSFQTVDWARYWPHF